jgi:hypothetical protein
MGFIPLLDHLITTTMVDVPMAKLFSSLFFDYLSCASGRKEKREQKKISNFETMRVNRKQHQTIEKQHHETENKQPEVKTLPFRSFSSFF